jgi:hypothetical protein
LLLAYSKYRNDVYAPLVDVVPNPMPANPLGIAVIVATASPSAVDANDRFGLPAWVFVAFAPDPDV